MQVHHKSLNAHILLSCCLKIHVSGGCIYNVIPLVFANTCRSFHLKESIMSSSKGSKRISVFDRLGPGNDDVGIYKIPHKINIYNIDSPSAKTFLIIYYYA